MSSPKRRVLGDKDANAYLHSHKSRNTTIKSHSTFEAQNSPVQTLKSPLSKIRVEKLSPQAGHKRKIQDVQEEEENSQHSQLLSESSSDNETFDPSLGSSHVVRSMADTNNTSFTVSQGADNAPEPQFELPQDEMSQKTLEKLHAVPMPQDESLPLPSRPGLVHEGSIGSAGMSSFINFEDSNSSEESDGLQPLEQPVEIEQTSAKGPEDNHSSVTRQDDGRKKMLNEKASQLKTRLQLAMFKVQTQQVTRPFKRLKTPVSKRAKSSSPPSFMQRLADDEKSQQRRNSKGNSVPRKPHLDPFLSPESRISAHRAQATAQSKPAVANLESLPMPTLQPTAFSARWPKQPANADSEQEEVMDDVRLPSSPPLSRVPSVPETHAHPGSVEEPVSTQRTPKTPAVTDSVAEMQLSSPPASDTDQDDTAGGEAISISDRKWHRRKGGAKSLTSSVVKGEAADGLLQLMRSNKGV